MKLVYTLFIWILPQISFGQDSVYFTNPSTKDSLKLKDKFVRLHIVGKWKDQNSTMYFYASGKCKTVMDDSTIRHGFWEAKKGKLLITEKPTYEVLAYKILYFSNRLMNFQLVESYLDPTIWTARKIGRFSE